MNALGTLFGDIASAIREKTGDTATMKPAEFPEKIAAIEAGGGGGSSGIKGCLVSVTLGGKWGERVSVDFGFVPGMIVLYPQSYVNTSSSSYMLAFGINTAFSEIMATGYRQHYTYIYSSKTTSSSTGTSIDSTDTNTAIYNADETGFNLGKTFCSGNYYVFALGL